VEVLLWGAEPRFEIGSALPYRKPTRYYLSHTAEKNTKGFKRQKSFRIFS
jgi:hypothetical protein